MPEELERAVGGVNSAVNPVRLSLPQAKKK